MALGGAVSGCIGLLAPKFLPNASGGRNGEGLEGGGWVVEEGGGVATAVPAAAVQKPRKNINLSEKVTLSRPIGRIGRNS